MYHSTTMCILHTTTSGWRRVSFGHIYVQIDKYMLTHIWLAINHKSHMRFGSLSRLRFHAYTHKCIYGIFLPTYQLIGWDNRFRLTWDFEYAASIGGLYGKVKMGLCVCVWWCWVRQIFHHTLRYTHTHTHRKVLSLSVVNGLDLSSFVSIASLCCSVNIEHLQSMRLWLGWGIS